MSHPIIKAVKAIGSLHQNISDPKHFPKVVLAVLASSGLAGYGLMQVVDRQREANMKMHFSQEANENIIDDVGIIHKNTSISHNESMVRAMVENAKSLSPRENLENAAMAQKNFMLVPFDESVTNGEKDIQFVQKIARRGEEIRNGNKQQTE